MKTLKRILAVMMSVLMLVSTVSVGMTSVAAKKKVKKIKLNKTSITIYVGETYKLKATVSPSNASNKKVTFHGFVCYTFNTMCSCKILQPLTDSFFVFTGSGYFAYLSKNVKNSIHNISCFIHY